MSNYIIGKNAVAAIDQAAIIDGPLMTEIPVGDTYPSWDGEILVYASEEARNQRKKSELIGRLPVQVKGHHVKEFSTKERSEDIEVADLINYSNDAGVFYLVVEMTSPTDVNQTKIYYSELLKYDIEQITKGKENQQTIRHTFQELPKDKFYSLCKHFLIHRKEQGYKLIKWNGKLEYEEYSFTVVGNKKSDLDFYLFDSGTYIYGINKNSHLKDPLGRFKAVTKIERDNIDVGTSDKVFYTQIYREKTKDSLSIGFGKSFTMSLLDDGNIKFNFTEKGTLRERIKDCEFFLGLLEEGKICLNHSEILLNLEEDVPKDMKDTLPQYIKELKDILSVFNHLGVEPNEDFDTFRKDLKEIHFLIRAIIEKSIDTTEVVDTNLQLVSIGNYDFMLAKGVGKFKNTLFNLFDYEEVKEKFNIFVSTEDTFENPIEHTPYITIQPNILFECANLNIDSIHKALIAVDYTNEVALEITNQYLLRCLFYIDENKNSKRNDILMMISNVYQYIYERTGVSIYFVNQMQAIYRLRDLNKEESYELTEMKMETKDHEAIKCAIDILLGNKDDFWYRIDRLPETPEDNKSLILDYPIYNLIKEEN